MTAGRTPHKIMTSEEYASMVITGWHEVCKNVDGHGGVGVRFLGEPEGKFAGDPNFGDYNIPPGSENHP